MVVIGVIATAIGIPIALIDPVVPGQGLDPGRQHPDALRRPDHRHRADLRAGRDRGPVLGVEVPDAPGQEEMDGPPIHGNTRLEVVWTAVPAILIVVAVHLRLHGPALQRGQQDGRDDRQHDRPASSPSSSRTRRPAASRSSRPCCTCPVNRPVVFKIRSLDVIHSFFVPELLREDRRRARDHHHAARDPERGSAPIRWSAPSCAAPGIR